MLLVNTDCLSKKDAEILKAQIEQQTKERRMLELDYKARLKDDMVAMLEEIQSEFKTEKQDTRYFLYDDLECAENYNFGIDDCINIIQDKINKLKGE